MHCPIFSNIYDSEQILSLLDLNVEFDENDQVISSGGIIIQLMPDAGNEAIKFLKENLNKIDFVKKIFLKGYTPEEILIYIFGEKNLNMETKH